MKIFFALLTLLLYSCEKQQDAPANSSTVKEKININSPFVGNWLGESSEEAISHGTVTIPKKILLWKFTLNQDGSFLLKVSGDGLAQEDVISGQWRAEESFITMYPVKTGKLFFPWAHDIKSDVGFLIPITAMKEGFEFRFAGCDQAGLDYYVEAKKVKQ